MPIREGDTIIFYVNTSGFPLSKETTEQMWSFAKELQPQAADLISKLEAKDDYAQVAMLAPPHNHLNSPKLSTEEKLDKIQEYIDKLQYNHTGMQFFDIRKERPLAGLMDVARKIIDECLPIKCLEAVILSIYLTNELSTIDKFSIGFKTSSKGNVYRHVVLGVYCHSTCKFGALGTSRRSELAYKPLGYDTLSGLIQDYVDSYAVYLHKVKRVRIGLPIPNSNRSYESIPWNGVTVYPSSSSAKQLEWQKSVEKHSRSIRIYKSFCAFSLSHSNNNLYESKEKLMLQQQVEALARMDISDDTKQILNEKVTKISSAYKSGSVLLPRRKVTALRV